MISIMEIDGYKAVIKYDPEMGMFRGEFVGLNGGADFYARSVEGLRKEGKKSLKVFLKMCAEDGVNPCRKFTGRFNLRISPDLHVGLPPWLTPLVRVSTLGWLKRSTKR